MAERHKPCMHEVPPTIRERLHQVYAIVFNNPFGNLVATGSFDKTAMVWDVSTGQCCHHLKGKQTFGIPIHVLLPCIVQCLGTAFDNTVHVLCVITLCDNGLEHGHQVLHSLPCWLHLFWIGHEMEIVCLSFNQQGTILATGSMDHTAKVRHMGRCVVAQIEP